MRRSEYMRHGSAEEIYAVQELIFLLAGIYSILLVIRSVPGISFSAAAVSTISVFVCGGLYVTLRLRSKLVWAASAGIIVLCAIIAAARWELLAEQAYAFAECIRGGGEQGTVDITFAVLLVSTMISVCLFMIELVNKHHIIPYLFVTAIMIGAPLFGISAGIVPAVFALVFLVLFMTVHTAEGGRRSVSEKSKARIGLRCGVYMLAALAVLSAVSCMIVSRWSLEISDAVYAGEGAVSRSLQRITGTARSSDSDGRISSGNNYQTGETRLEVTLLDEPNETLYLKGFSGGDYIGGEWEEADNRRIFREMADVLRWDNWESWISGMYYSMYFIMNTAAADNARPHTMFVTHINETYNTIYTPYYSSRPNMNSSSGAGYLFNYFSQSDMTDDWENVSYDFRTASGWYWDIQNSYMQAMPKHYIQVPEDIVPRLSELCRNNPMTSRDDITEFIISTLQSRASYTLTPGRAPFNEDIVEYFLFENHEGYCVHFASAATLMYRLYGIPARYASGYAVEPEDFSRQDGDLWTAEVTDRSAHAWTEIFIENYGWVPVEVTPASDGSYDTFYPGMETDIPEETAAPESGSTTEEAADENEDSTDITIDTDESTDASCAYSCDTGEDNYRAYIIAAAVMILLIPLMLHCRRIYMVRKIKEMNCRRVFGRFIRMLHSAGYMTGLYGTEKDFAAKLAEELPCVSLEEAERMLETAGRAAYGRDMPPEEETEFVREIYFRTADYIAESLKLIPRLRFKYISAFC